MEGGIKWLPKILSKYYMSKLLQVFLCHHGGNRCCVRAVNAEADCIDVLPNAGKPIKNSECKAIASRLL